MWPWTKDRGLTPQARAILIAAADAWGPRADALRERIDRLEMGQPTHEGRILPFRKGPSFAVGRPEAQVSLAGVVSGRVWVDVLVTQGELHALMVSAPNAPLQTIDAAYPLAWPYDRDAPLPGDGGTRTGATAHRPPHPHGIRALQGRSGHPLPADLREMAETVDELVFTGFAFAPSQARMLPLWDGITVTMVIEESETGAWGVVLRSDRPGLFWHDQEAGELEDEALPNLSAALARARHRAESPQGSV